MAKALKQKTNPVLYTDSAKNKRGGTNNPLRTLAFEMNF